MFEKISDPREVRLVEGHIPLQHRYTPGVAGEAFFASLMKGEFLASGCERCGIVYCPNRIFCERCMGELEADRTVGPRGRIESFTVLYAGVEGEPLDEPRTIGLVRLEGADTVLMHELVGFDEGPQIGDEVEPDFEPRSRRTGSILDLRGFRPAR
ncbi:MAG TPA: Zn-ribbon domain-containing OB-fold protein [Actinomycetota bacterium]